MTLPREGVTIDLVAALIRYSLLNAFVTIPAFSIILWKPVLSHISSQTSPAHATFLASITGFLAATSAILSANDYLNKWHANNWVSNSTWNWKHEIVVVTGGSSGIGASVCQQLLKRNHRTKIVVLDCVPLTWTPPSESSTVHFYRCDLSDSSAVKSVCEKLREEVGYPTVLINNAGLSRGFTVMEGSYLDVEVTIRTNLVAPFLLIKEFLPYMVRRNHGHIVNIASMSALLPPAGIADYAATKAGLIAMHEALQLELKYKHHAPRVRQTLGIFSFIRTPLFKGETKQSEFFFPLLHVETVSEALVDTIYGGYGKTIYMPGIMRYVAMLRGCPDWMTRMARESTNQLGVDFRGRQSIDSKRGTIMESPGYLKRS